MKFEDLFLKCVFTFKSLREFQNVETDTSKDDNYKVSFILTLRSNL
jgi:hypothetical protein